MDFIQFILELFDTISNRGLIMFIFGAILIGQIATKSTIAKRIATAVLLRVGTSYSRLLLGLIVTDFLLTFIVPSGISRLVIMAAVPSGAWDRTRW